MQLADTFFSSTASISSLIMEALKPWRRSSASKLARPRSMFSSRRSRLNHCLILFRAWLLLHRFSQSRLGPLAVLEVMISTISPFCRVVS